MPTVLQINGNNSMRRTFGSGSQYLVRNSFSDVQLPPFLGSSRSSSTPVNISSGRRPSLMISTTLRVLPAIAVVATVSPIRAASSKCVIFFMLHSTAARNYDTTDLQ